MREVEDWSELFEGIEEVAALPGMQWAWLSGLSWHPSADVLVRLVGHVRSMPLTGTYPAEVVDAAVAHPDWKIRAAWAEHQRGMSLAQWVRLIGSESAGWRWYRLLTMAGWHSPRPSGAEFAGWAADPDPQVRLRALWFRGLPDRVAAALVADPDPEVRATLCEHAWRQLTAEHRAVLAADPDPRVRDATRIRADRERPMSRTEFEALDEDDQWDAVGVQHLDHDLARHLLDHPDHGLRATLAENEQLTPDLVAVLAEDADEHVRATVAVRPDAPENLRAKITAGLPPSHPYWRVLWVEDLHDDPEAMRRLAGSASIAVRRAVARARRLPPDVLDLLSRDPTSGVRSALVAHNEAPPVHLLLEAATTWTDPWPVLRRPDFPLDALNGLADHPDPKRRRLALDAPDSTAELAERLADDPEPLVHGRAAADPRLSPATVLRLLASTDRDFRDFHENPGRAVPGTGTLRGAAIRNPRLPVATLIGLLRDPHSAQTAAGNPALPASVAHRLIDLVTDRVRAGSPDRLGSLPGSEVSRRNDLVG